jgi:hypothetical protein
MGSKKKASAPVKPLKPAPMHDRPAPKPVPESKHQLAHDKKS